jgi:hypothetical protein
MPGQSGRQQQALKRNFDTRAATDIVQVPLANDKNEHTENPSRNIGVVTGLEREGSKVYALIDARDAEAAGKLGKTLLGASAMLHLNATDNRTGGKVGPALYHVAVTNRPYVVDLEPYAEVVAATAEAYDIFSDGTWREPEALMLCQPSPESVALAGGADDYDGPDYPGPGPGPDYRQPDYGGTMPGINEEIRRLSLRAEGIAAGRRHEPFRPSEHIDWDQAAYEHEARRAEATALTATEADWQASIRLAAAATGESYGECADRLRAEARKQCEAHGWGSRCNELAVLCAVAQDDLERHGGTLSLSAGQLGSTVEDEVARFTAGPGGRLELLELAQSRVPANPKEPAEPELDAYLDELEQRNPGTFALPRKKQEADSPRRLPPHLNTDNVLPSQRVLLEYHAARGELGPEKPSGQYSSAQPKSLAQRRREQARATTRPENRIGRR